MNKSKAATALGYLVIMIMFSIMYYAFIDASRMPVGGYPQFTILGLIIAGWYLYFVRVVRVYNSY
jgi:hypothetical protein